MTVWVQNKSTKYCKSSTTSTTLRGGKSVVTERVEATTTTCGKTHFTPQREANCEFPKKLMDIQNQFQDAVVFYE